MYKPYIRRTLSGEQDIESSDDEELLQYSPSPFPCPPDGNYEDSLRIKLPGSPVCQFENQRSLGPAKNQQFEELFNFSEEIGLKAL